MAYNNSDLVAYKRISPNRTSPRNHEIDRITPHCIVGQLSASAIANLSMFTQYDSRNGSSCNYAIGREGDVALIVEEKDRSWCSSSGANDNRAVTIECASDTTDPYAINNKVYAKLVELMADICRRNGKTKLLWIPDKDKALAYKPEADEMLITVHRWFANKACPGDYIYKRLGKIAEEVTVALGGEPVTQDKYVVRLAFDKPVTQTNSFNNLEYAKKEADRYPGYSVYVAATGECVYTSTEEEAYTPAEWIAMTSPIAMELAKKNYILPSVVIAQTCLETGFGKTDLTRVYNILGMKADLINGSWQEYSVWDGKTYTKKTPEYVNGQLVYVDADFRVYKTFRECVEDYEMFLLHVRNSKGLKYARLQGIKDPAAVLDILRVGTGTDLEPEGYFTDPYYKGKILELIEKYDLTQYDYVMSEQSGKETTVLGCMEKYQARLETDKANGEKWVYAEYGCPTSFDVAITEHDLKANEFSLFNWTLHEIGVTELGQIVKCDDNGSLLWENGAEDAIKDKCDVLHVNGESTVRQAIRNGILSAGDCVVYQKQARMEVYGGEKVWYDSSSLSAEDGVFDSWRYESNPNNSKVAYIIRYGKKSVYYRVQVGAYTSKANAEARAKAVRAKTGFDCFVEKSDWYRVYCGSFKLEANAKLRVQELAERGILDAIIKKVNEN